MPAKHISQTPLSVSFVIRSANERHLVGDEKVAGREKPGVPTLLPCLPTSSLQAAPPVVIGFPLWFSLLLGRLPWLQPLLRGSCDTPSPLVPLVELVATQLPAFPSLELVSFPHSSFSFSSPLMCTPWIKFSL